MLMVLPINTRYAKQVLFRPIGQKGQAAIAAGKVTVIGLGALGTVSSNQLCRAGVGFLKLVDRDYVEYSNLQRQILYDEKDAQALIPKTVAAAAKLSAANSEINIEPLVADISPRNIEPIIAGSSLVVDATDNIETRLLINDACIKNKIPWIYGAVLGSIGMTMSIVPGVTPCLRCHIDDLPAPGSIPSCDTEGVLSMATGTVASLQSAEALKLLIGLEPTPGMLYLDVWNRDFETLGINKRDDCPACGKNEFDFLNEESYSFTTTLCGRNAVQISPPVDREINLEKLSGRLKTAGEVSYNGYLLNLRVDNFEIVLFPNGRAIIHGTDDEAVARTIFARYIGT